jgi:hypothetical protein
MAVVARKGEVVGRNRRGLTELRKCGEVRDAFRGEYMWIERRITKAQSEGTYSLVWETADPSGATACEPRS